MRAWLTAQRCKLLLLLALFQFTGYYAQAQQGLRITTDFGYSSEDFRWSIAGNLSGTTPNVYSELKWKGVAGPALNVGIQFKLWKKFGAEGLYGRQFSSAGKVNDTDYGLDNRTDPIYNGNFSSDKGYTDAWKAGINYQLISGNIFSLMPSAGYGVSRQELFLVDHSGMYPNLNSSYTTSWSGPYLRALAMIKLGGPLRLSADVIYNQVSYKATANWNLITQFQHPISYRHSASGFGVEAHGKLLIQVTNKTNIALGAGYFNWQTGTGTDQLYLQSGQTDKTQLNEAIRNGFDVTAGLMVSFK